MKLNRLLLAVLAASNLIGLAACQTPTSESVSPSTPSVETKEMVLEDVTVTYDGSVHKVEVQNVPEGAKVSYVSPNKYKQPGTYQIKAKVTLADGTTKDGFIIYSLGNFISGQNTLPRQSSAILNLGITKDGLTGKISISQVDYIPVYMYKSPNASKLQRYKLLDIEANIEKYEAGEDTSLGKTTYNTMKEALEDITGILGEEIIASETLTN